MVKDTSPWVSVTTIETKGVDMLPPQFTLQEFHPPNLVLASLFFYGGKEP